MTRRTLAFVLALFTTCSVVVACAQTANSSGQASPQSSPPAKSGVTIQLGKPAPQSSASQQPTNPADESAALAEADRLLTTGKSADAQAKYQAVVNVDPGSVRAQVGLTRALILQQKFDEAQSALDTALALQPQSPELFLTLGDLRFAQGKIEDAERAFVKAQNLKPNDTAPYLALARVYRAYSLYRRAYDNLKHAHELAPNDVPVQLTWFHSLPHQDRVPALEAYLATAKLNPQTAKVLQQYLAFV